MVKRIQCISLEAEHIRRNFGHPCDAYPSIVPGGLGFSNACTHAQARGARAGNAGTQRTRRAVRRDGRCVVGGGFSTGGGDGPFWIDLLHARPDYGATL